MGKCKFILRTDIPQVYLIIWLTHFKWVTKTPNFKASIIPNSIFPTKILTGKRMSPLVNPPKKPNLTKVSPKIIRYRINTNLTDNLRQLIPPSEPLLHSSRLPLLVLPSSPAPLGYLQPLSCKKAIINNKTTTSKATITNKTTNDRNITNTITIIETSTNSTKNTTTEKRKAQFMSKTSPNHTLPRISSWPFSRIKGQ